jgi:hypothetical protein
MRRAVPTILLALLSAAPAGARPHTRSYLAFDVGADFLTADTSGPVMEGSAEGMGDIGVGYQLSDCWLIEATYGFMGRWQLPRYFALDPTVEPPPDSKRVYRVTINPLFVRTHWARGGARTEYFKPQLSAGVGFVQVTRLLRNHPAVPPFDASQLLVSAEVGVAGLFVFSKTLMGWVGGRYRMTERRDIADDTRHMDGVSVLFGFRAFLPSPRDAAEPEPPRKKPPDRAPDTGGAQPQR